MSNGRLHEDVTVSLNRLILDYDQILICGPVFPHEVVGFSGGNGQTRLTGFAAPFFLAAALATAGQAINSRAKPAIVPVFRIGEVLWFIVFSLNRGTLRTARFRSWDNPRVACALSRYAEHGSSGN